MKNKAVKNVVGKRIGNWKITEQYDSKSGRPVLVDLVCICGNVAVNRRYRNLISGMSMSCGIGKCHYSKRKS
jgi:hypothetical protein